MAGTLAAETTPVMLSLVTPVQAPSSDHDVTGLRLSLIYGECQEFTGLDIGVIGNARKDFTGLAVGGLNFAGERSSCLQSHMLEVCPLIATDKPKLEVHFLGIGIRKQQTARLVFTSKTGAGIKATVVDLGNRFRLISQEVECIEPKPMPNLPVASALWIPQPTFEIGAAAWILAGGTHHSAFSYDINEEYWADFAEMLGIEYVRINKDTNIADFKQTLQNNEMYYMLR